MRKARSEEREARNEERDARSEERGARSQESHGNPKALGIQPLKRCGAFAPDGSARAPNVGAKSHGGSWH